jgi:hypothetical protein
MLVGELILRKRILKRNVEDVKKYLAKKEETSSRATYTEFMDQLFGYIEQVRSHDVILNRSNEITSIEIGKKEVSVSDAVYIREAIFKKINIMSSMIEHNTTRDLDIFNLISERDKLFEEYLYISTLVNKSDWSTEIE